MTTEVRNDPSVDVNYYVSTSASTFVDWRRRVFIAGGFHDSYMTL